MLRGFEICGKPFAKWRMTFDKRMISLPAEPIFARSDRIFTMGSCFAAEIRGALTALGVPTLPDYVSIPLDPARYVIDTLPAQLHMNYYNTFSIRQEFERFLGGWKQEMRDYWEVGVKAPHDASVTYACQDPYRRMVFGRAPEDLAEAVEHINRAMREGIARADAFFFTLGMTEVFRKHDDGRFACQKPAYLGGGGAAETSLHVSGFEENFANMKRVVDIIHGVNPRARVVITVSPVPLERTFSGRDVYVANMEGKSTLRAVAGELARACPNVLYFPSYELVMGVGEQAFHPKDLRHIHPNVVRIVTQAFVAAYFAPEAQARAQASA